MIKKNRNINEGEGTTFEQIEQNVYVFLKEAVAYMLEPNPIVDPNDGFFGFAIPMTSQHKRILNIILDDANKYADEGGYLEDWNVMSTSFGKRGFAQLKIEDNILTIEFRDDAIAMEIEVDESNISVDGEVFEFGDNPILVPLGNVLNFKRTDILKIK